MRYIDFDTLCSKLKSYSGEDVLITFHSIGDRDSVGSAVALSRYIRGSAVATPDFITNNARRMLEFAGFKGQLSSKFDADRKVVIVMDANNLAVLDGFASRLKGFDGEILFIDHHIGPAGSDSEQPNMAAFNDETFNSTASIVYEALKRNGFKTGKPEAALLLNGIVADSADLQNADSRTFLQMSELTKISGTSYSQLTEYYHANIPAANRLMTISDLQGATAEREGTYVIVYGRAAAHANIAADAAISIGADAAIFWAVTETEASLSARLRSPLDKTLGIHLGKFMEEVAGVVGGTGGGHACAAGAYGNRKSNAEVAGKIVLGKIKEKLH